MPTSLDDILELPWDEPIPPCWIEPDLVLFDDITGLSAIRTLNQLEGNRSRPAYPGRIQITSQIDRENSLPDRLRDDDLLLTTAQNWQVPFLRGVTDCDHDHPVPDTIFHANQIMACTKPPTSFGAMGGLGISANTFDLVHAYRTGKAWYRRPPIQAFCFHGKPRAGVTLHDIAIALRPDIHRQSLLLFSMAQDSADSSDLRLNALTALLADSPASWVLYHPLDHAKSTPVSIHLDRYEAMIGIGNDSALPLSELTPTAIDRVYIGSCSTGSVEDLRMAARELAGRRVTVPTVIAPSTMNDAQRLETSRLDPDDSSSPVLAQIFHDSGCDIGLPGCSTCVNAIADLLDQPDHQEPHGKPARASLSNLTVVATAVGSVTAQSVARVFTASPATAARAAVHGMLGLS